MNAFYPFALMSFCDTTVYPDDDIFNPHSAHQNPCMSFPYIQLVYTNEWLSVYNHNEIAPPHSCKFEIISPKFTVPYGLDPNGYLHGLILPLPATIYNKCICINTVKSSG